MTIVELFENVDASGDCWLWTRATTDGYGQVRLKGARKLSYVHRIVWTHLVGPIPDGLQIDHLCRQKRCCNPDHLEVVTRRTNIRRSIGVTDRRCRYGHSDWYVYKSGYYEGQRYCAECNRRQASSSYRKQRERA